jgi:hypothetical protein
MLEQKFVGIERRGKRRRPTRLPIFVRRTHSIAQESDPEIHRALQVLRAISG